MTLLLAPPEPAVDDSYSIVFEDAHIAVVNKPGNLPCHPSGRYHVNSLSVMLATRGGFPAAHMVNRLDRETSGLVLAAKTPEAASVCGRDLMAGFFAKSYLVLVAGCWTLPREYTATGSIRLVRGGVVWKKRVFEKLGSLEIGKLGNAQTATTVFRLLETNSNRNLSLLQADPVTGRPHQIRATLKALGYPVAGDKLYGPDETIYSRMCEGSMTSEDITALGGFPHQCLHSWRLSFPHPFTRETLSFEAPAPDWFNV